ncbi:MAG: cysteine--tRNA ligase [Mariniblastus sp.]|nr:cysteine--tRNA ligase [Mariniblastus sp.]
MSLQLYNSLTNQMETFESLEPGVVRMYSCGPTVYDFAHIGNFRSFLFGDLLRRTLELFDYQVHHVMNITDVGHMVEGETDKMSEAANRMKVNKKSGRVPEGAVEDPNDPYQIADYYTNAFLEDARKLGYKIASEYPENVPKATDHIEGMQGMIKRLIERDHAYVAEDGVVYFSVESFPKYGELSGNTLEKLQSGAGGRVSDENQSRKRHPADFMLWKPDQHHVMKWDSPWGVGYPGWHIECSVMASELLGRDVIDIHTGGEDLIFPHHECEIAQSCGASGAESFARYWIHARFLMVEGEKMSKSKGNFFTARDVFNGDATGSEVHPAVLRYELIKSHYRANMNFTKKGLEDSSGVVKRMLDFEARLEQETGGQAAEVDLSHPVLSKFAAALSSDLNISEALAVVIPWLRQEHRDPRESLAVWRAVNSVLGITDITEESAGGDPIFDQVQQWGEEMKEARSRKDWDASDAARQKIIDAGYEVQMVKDGGVVITKSLA